MKIMVIKGILSQEMNLDDVDLVVYFPDIAHYNVSFLSGLTKAYSMGLDKITDLLKYMEGYKNKDVNDAWKKSGNDVDSFIALLSELLQTSIRDRLFSNLAPTFKRLIDANVKTMVVGDFDHNELNICSWFVRHGAKKVDVVVRTKYDEEGYLFVAKELTKRLCETSGIKYVFTSSTDINDIDVLRKKLKVDAEKRGLTVPTVVSGNDLLPCGVRVMRI
jgi:hypothetical protein